MRIKLSTLLVENQDHAKDYYTNMLGFQVETDASYGEDYRWLSVVAPDDPEGPHLLLQGTNFKEAQAFQEATRRAEMPAISFTVDDCAAETKRLKEKGVEFTMEPTQMPYGGTDAVFDDTCGNLICLHQD